MLELKPCPFCGGEAEWVETPTNYVHYVRCKKCNAMVGRTTRTQDYRRRKLWFENATGAIEAWNRRVNDE